MLLKLIKPIVTNRIFIVLLLLVLFVLAIASGALYAMLYDTYTNPNEVVELNLVVEMVKSFDDNCTTEFITDEGNAYLIGRTCGKKIKVFSLPKEDVDVYYKFILQE